MVFKFQRLPARAVGRLLTLVVISLLAAFLRLLGPMPGASDAMMLGFLLLAAFVAGELARDLRLPRITGYLIIGILFGPHVASLLPRDTVTDFRLINNIALSVIALQAGGELRIARLRHRLASIGTITAFQVVMTMAGVTAMVYLAHGLFPFLQGQTARSVLAVALIFGLVAVAKSPATTIAVITELRAHGSLTDTVLGVSVLKDVLILLMIGVLIPTAALLVEPGLGFDFRQVGELSLAITASLALGGGVGGLMVLYLKKVNRQPILFVLAVAFGIVDLSRVLGFESEAFILMSIAAGFVVQNFSVQGPTFVEALEANSLPLYALFFAVAGADLDLAILPSVWHIGLLLIVTRTALIYLSTYLGARAAHDREMISRYAWMGFVAQAGVTLGLATILRERFSDWGPQVADIIVAMIAVNQLIGPPLFRYALLRAGESHVQPTRAPVRGQPLGAAARRRPATG